MFDFLNEGTQNGADQSYSENLVDVDNDQLKQAILAELASAPSPYQGSIGQAYLDNAWLKGAEYMAQRCVELLEQSKDIAR